MAIKISERGARAALVLVSLCVSLVAAEIFLKLIRFSYSPLQIKHEGRINDWRYNHSFEHRDFVHDPRLLWRPKANRSVFNAQGYRGELLAPAKPAGAYRIFAIGDSNTLGWREGPNWPEYLQELLRAERGDIAVANAGVWGYSAFQGLQRFKEALEWRPDMVLISFGANDAHLVAMADAEFNRRALAMYSPLFYRFKLGQLAIAAAEQWIVARPRLEVADLVHRVGPQAYKEYLGEIAAAAAADGIECVLLTRPFIGASPNELWWKHFAPEYVAATAEVGARYQIPVIDLYAHFAGKAEYFADESHFNESGYRLAAQIIHQRIRPLIGE